MQYLLIIILNWVGEACGDMNYCHITKYAGRLVIKNLPPSPFYSLREFTTVKGLVPSLTELVMTSTELVMTVPRISRNLEMLIHIIQTHRKLKDIHQNVNALTHFEEDNCKWNKYPKGTKNQ